MPYHFDHDDGEITRRCFLFCGSVPVVAGVAVVAAEAAAHQAAPQGDPKIVAEKQKALRDPTIATEVVKFANGADEIQGFLARPKAAERSPAVVVVPGDFGLTEYTRITAANLAQAGFVALGVDVFSRASQIKNLEEARRVYFDVMTDALTLRDLQAAIDYLKKQTYVRDSGVGLLGFCVGGRYALLLAALSRDVAATAVYYGPLQLIEGKPDVTVAKPLKVPGHEMSPLDFALWIKSPVHGHYARKDSTIPLADVERFERVLRERRADAEMFVYDTDSHFHSYHQSTYDPPAAKLSWERTVAFFRKNVK